MLFQKALGVVASTPLPAVPLCFALTGLLASPFPSAAQAVVYPAPAGETLSTQYELQAGGQPVPVYTARVLDPPFAGKEYDYGGPYSFASFDVSGPVEVRIRSEKPLGNLVVRPANPRVKTRLTDGNTAIVSLPGLCKLSIEPEGKKGPLLLFANSIEEHPPRASEAGPHLIYFGPGIHRPGKITLTNNQSLYLAGGAVVKGGILAEGDNIRIFGRGILDSTDWEWRKGPAMRTTVKPFELFLIHYFCLLGCGVVEAVLCACG
jgi:hypothetical protein